MSKRPGPNKDNLEYTRKIFIDIAKREFCEHGYPNASTTRIVEDSGMARGSLYYHFGDKNGLFKAIYEELLDAASLRITEAMMRESAPVQALLVSAEVFLDLCMEDDFRKIVLIQSQSALGYLDRLEVLNRTILGKLRALMPALFQAGYFPGHTPETALIFLYGVLGEYGRSLDFVPAADVMRGAFGRAFAQTIKQLGPMPG